MTAVAPALPDYLRDKYIAQLSQRRADLAQFLARFEQSAASPGDTAAARIHAHSLKGTGRMYGYPEIGATGRALEDAIDSKSDQTALAALTRALMAACDEALKGEKPATAEMPVASIIEAAQAPVRAANGRQRLLVVDDDLAVRDMLQNLLRNEADIFSAADSEAALSEIDRTDPDLILLDDNMPGASGLSLLEHMQRTKHPTAARIVMLTANKRTPDIINGMCAGAVDYITKPFEPDRLVNRVRNLLRCLRMTILVADDDIAVRGLLQHKFRMLGFRLLHAEDGEQAIELAREKKPQLAIIDRMMPGLDGLAVLRRMREDEELRQIPVILLTAKRQNKDVVEGFHLGANDYIVKPFMPEEVIARAMRLLGLNDMSQQ